ncbi:MAG: B12-binding domain-containing radical SAM protein [Trichloromonas sp.]|jgi:radical SAM superfamily enzyme YgiQ (UPF0313 family)|nr:B12-binding domain-containing radical SAM protein [Trichloromonas sp.]
MRILLPTLHVRPSPQAVPLAAACLKAALPEESRRRTALLDLYPRQSDAEMLAVILAAAPDLVAFPLYVWNRRRLLTLARQLRQARPGLLLVAGGPEVMADSARVRAEGIFDYLIGGEGEEPFAALVARLGRGERPSATPPLAASPPPPEELPSPWLNGALIPIEGGGVLWETSRGCPFACAFCFDSRGTRGLRPLPMPRLEAELDLFVRHRVGQIWILDSTFNHPPERGKELLRLLGRKAPHIHVHLEAKADFLDRETARLLGRLSCSVQVGLQSARPEVLRCIHRNFEPREFARKIQLLNQAGVTFGFDLIYGLPGDDYAGFRQSLDFALELTPNHLDIFPLAVLPGTELHRDAAELGLRAQTEPPYEILESPSCTTSDLDACRRLAAAVDLFYNTGRAVAFFSALLRVPGWKASDFLLDFADWALTVAAISRERFLDGESWQAADALELQEGYLGHLFKKLERPDLLPAALDLLRYHFHYAETLLGPETLPSPPEALRHLDPWRTPLRLAEGVRLVHFSYEILDLLEMEDPDLEEVALLFRPVGSVAVFLRRGEQVLCESLEEDFLVLLYGCDGRRSPEEIFAGTVIRAEGEEIVRFALAEGFLLPTP